MGKKVLITAVFIALGVVLVVVNYRSSNLEYATFDVAGRTTKRIQVKGEFVKERQVWMDLENKRFTFYMKDDSGEVVKVVLNGTKPNNFDAAPSIVVRGKMTGDYFAATEVLTKCPSKYTVNDGLAGRDSIKNKGR